MNDLNVLDVLVVDLTEFVDNLDPALWDDEQAVNGIARLATLQERVRGAQAVLEARVIELLPAGETFTVPGVGAVVVEAKGRSNTRGGKLARRLAALIADTPVNEDGEPLPPGVLCERTADELVNVFGLDTPSARFRSGEVKARGLRPGEFMEWTDGVPKVRFLDGAA